MIQNFKSSWKVLESEVRLHINRYSKHLLAPLHVLELTTRIVPTPKLTFTPFPSGALAGSGALFADLWPLLHLGLLPLRLGLLFLLPPPVLTRPGIRQQVPHLLQRSLGHSLVLCRGKAVLSG